MFMQTGILSTEKCWCLSIMMDVSWRRICRSPSVWNQDWINMEQKTKTKIIASKGAAPTYQVTKRAKPETAYQRLVNLSWFIHVYLTSTEHQKWPYKLETRFRQVRHKERKTSQIITESSQDPATTFRRIYGRKVTVCLISDICCLLLKAHSERAWPFGSTWLSQISPSITPSQSYHTYGSQSNWRDNWTKHMTSHC